MIFQTAAIIIPCLYHARDFDLISPDGDSNLEFLGFPWNAG